MTKTRSYNRRNRLMRTTSSFRKSNNKRGRKKRQSKKNNTERRRKKKRHSRKINGGDPVKSRRERMQHALNKGGLGVKGVEESHLPTAEAVRRQAAAVKERQERLLALLGGGRGASATDIWLLTGPLQQDFNKIGKLTREDLRHNMEKQKMVMHDEDFDRFWNEMQPVKGEISFEQLNEGLQNARMLHAIRAIDESWEPWK